MKVSLREITPQNFKECIELQVAESQKNFVAPNVYSIAESKVSPNYKVRAVYSAEEMVGFVMFGLDTDDGRHYLGRLMIGEKQQGKGFGKAAVLSVIEQLSQLEDCREVFLSVSPENSSAESLYSNIGFERTGELNGHEIVMRLNIKRN